MDHCEANERSAGARVALEVAHEPSVTDPGEGTVDDQRLGRTTKRNAVGRV